MKLKLPLEVWAMVLVIVVPLTVVEILHIQAHSDHCKTESEWKKGS